MDVMYEIAIGLINSYIETNLRITQFCIRQSWFDEVLYARWAAEELKLEIMNYGFDHPAVITDNQLDVDDLIDSFIVKMNNFLSIKDAYPFYVAMDTAEGIRRYLKSH